MVRQQIGLAERPYVVPLQLDASLIEAAFSDSRSLEQLIAAVWPEAYRLAAGILHDRNLAEDAAQEACASMAAKLSSLKTVAAFGTWFYRLVVNEALTISRRRRETVTLHEVESKAIAFDEAQALDLSNALRHLPAEQRAVVLLHYYVGLNSREIAAAARLPAPTVRFHLMLARRALRRALALSTHSASTEVLSNAN
jgi:RNA polymerase sigma factor (sigma-70 family)